MTNRRTVRLMSDYSVGWPLWDAEGAMGRAGSDVSHELAARLYAWQESFEEGFHHEHGWRSAEQGAAYAIEGRELQRLLTAEIGSWAHVELDLWPTTSERE